MAVCNLPSPGAVECSQPGFPWTWVKGRYSILLPGPCPGQITGLVRSWCLTRGPTWTANPKSFCVGTGVVPTGVVRNPQALSKCTLCYCLEIWSPTPIWSSSQVTWNGSLVELQRHCLVPEPPASESFGGAYTYSHAPFNDRDPFWETHHGSISSWAHPGEPSHKPL